MSFDWLSFLQARNIPFSTEGDDSRGKAPAKDNVMTSCPWCGASTGVDYMHISLTGKGWYCWRRPNHSGRNPTRLVAALLGVSIGEALSITGQHNYIPADFLEAVMSKLSPVVETPPKRILMFPSEFKRIGFRQSFALATKYLQKRGFSDYAIECLTDYYDVYFCRTGAYNNRIIFPVSFERKLVTWTGRTISKNQSLRYKALSTDPERAAKEGYKPAIGKITDYLLWYDELMRGPVDTLIVTEGPFDALKISTLGRNSGVVATCLFTNRASKAQVDLLYQLLPRFRNRFLMLDQGTLDAMLRMSRDLKTLGLRHLVLPPNIKDPGELTRDALMRVLGKGA